MENLTQQQIEALIQFIDGAEDPATVTNTIVAAVLAFLADKAAGMATAQALLEEVVARQTADTNLSNSITQLQQLIQNIGTVVYLDSMGRDLDEADVRPDTGMLVYDPDNMVIKKYNTPDQYDIIFLDEKFLYCNRATGYFYRTSSHSGMVQVGKINVINDLATGGVGDALSAEMGKRLGERVNELEDAVEEIGDGAGYDISIVGQQLVITSRNKTSVNVGEVSNHNVACKAGRTATASFYVSGRKLTSAIQIAVSDATNWQVSPASISPVDGKVALTLVTITYRPAAGTASGTTHNCNVTVTCGGVTYGTIAMQGTVAAAPSITLTPATLNISTAEGTPATATVNVKGSALEGDIALAVSGTGFTLSQNTVAKADAESAAGADVTVTFDGSAAGTATITATATGATAANVEVNGNVVGRKAAGESWDDSNGMLTYTVLDDTSTVSVKQKSKTACTGAITIPASVNDDNGIGYRVIMVADNGFNQNTNITSVVMRDGGIEILGSGAFDGCTSLSSMTLPNTLKSIGNPSSSGYQNVIKGTQLTRLALPASLEKIFAYGIAENASLTELEIKGMPANSSGGEIVNHAIKANLVTVYTDIALKSTDDPLSVLPKITLASWGGSFLYGSIDGDSNTWNIYKDGNGVNQKITLVVPDDESVTAYNALRDKSGIGNVKGWGFFNIIKKSN